MGNTNGRTDDKQETINSSQSFAQRLTESQLVHNDQEASTQKDDFKMNLKLEKTFETNLYKECNHYKKDGNLVVLANIIGETLCNTCQNGAEIVGRSKRGHSQSGFDKDARRRVGDNRTNKNLRKDFEIIRVIGKGGFSTVFQVRRKDDGQIFAMKCLKKQQIKRENKVKHVMNEREILQTVNNPFIVKMNWAFQSEHYLFIVLEFCAGGEIFYHMNKVLRFSEKVAKFYFAEIVLALEYLHSKNIFYRDLKPENILLDQDGHIKLADFGISRQRFGEKERSNSFCGSPEYMSPEMLRTGRIHGRAVDYYSLGALLYEMLTGLPPHFSENRDEMYRKILHSSIEFPRYLSPMAKSLLKGLLMKNPDQRLGATYGIQEIKDHPFCIDINWEDAMQKKLLPPIRPSLKYSNFDPEYTSLPVRFTFEEDFLKPQHHTRRKSDPGLELIASYQNKDKETQIGIGNTNENKNLSVFATIGQAIIYPSFNDFNGEGSPEYSRPPSSTFRGYSFMNFRNDSISSTDQPNNPNQESNKQISPHNNQFLQSQNTVIQSSFTQQLNSQNLMQLKQQQQQSNNNNNIINILDEYQFTSSQRSRSISFANQSILTEGLEQQPKNIYQMDFKQLLLEEVQFKANEYEFNAYNHQFPKKWTQIQPLINKYRQTSGQPISAPVAQITEQILYQEALKNFEYGDGYQLPKIIKNMPDILEEVEQEGRGGDSPRNGAGSLNKTKTNNINSNSKTTSQNLKLDTKLVNETFTKLSNTDSVHDRVTSMLLSDQKLELDQYSKNLILFNDEINNIKSERKRKPQAKQIKKDQEISIQSRVQKIQNQNIAQFQDNQTEQLDRRKGAQSLHTNIKNFLTLDNRFRIESNYTTRSGEGHKLADVAELGSVKSGGTKYDNKSPKKSQVKQASPKIKPKATTMYYQSNPQKDLHKDLHKDLTKTQQLQHVETQAKSTMNQNRQQHSRIGSQHIFSPKLNKLDNAHQKSAQQQQNPQQQIISPKTTGSTKYSSHIDAKKPALNSSRTTNNKLQTSNTTKSRNSANSQHLSAGHLPYDKKNLLSSNGNQVQNTALKKTQLEKIDEFKDQASVTSKDLHSSMIKQPHTQSLLKPSTDKQLALTPQQAAALKKKTISRLNSPKNELNIDKNRKLKPSKNLAQNSQQTRNRLKTNSQYVTTQYSSKGNAKQGFFAVEETENDDQNHSEEKTSKGKNRIPRSQDREEKKSSSDNTLEDGDENVDEFVSNDNSNIQKLKNPSLITSIAGTTKQFESHHATKDLYSNTFIKSNFSASSSIMSQSALQQHSSQPTPDEMKTLNNSTTQKNPPQHFLGDSFINDGVPQTELIYDSPRITNTGDYTHYKSSIVSNSQHVQPSQSKANNVSSQKIQFQKKNKLHLQSQIYQQHKQTPTSQNKHLSGESPQPSSQQQNQKKPQKADPRYSFWNTKRKGQKTPSSSSTLNYQIADNQQEFQGLNIRTPKGSQSHAYSGFEEVKHGDRAETEIAHPSNDVEKMLFSKSEQKLNKTQKQGTNIINKSKNNNTAGNNMILRLTISQANKNL